MRAPSMLAAFLVALPLGAQGDRTNIIVADSAAQRIPFATVQLVGGVMRVADDSGRVWFNAPSKDSVRVQVRRMGFLPFTGWIRRAPDGGHYVATLANASRALADVRVEERRNTALARTGFYDRLDRTQNSARLARFITPEELDLRNPVKLSQMLQGEQTIRVRSFYGRPLVEGRGSRCGMAIILDGRLMSGMIEELINVELNSALRRDLAEVANSPEETDRVMRRYAATMTSIDELIGAGSVAAVEIYPSPATVPAELNRMTGAQSCGAIAIWSGGRR